MAAPSLDPHLSSFVKDRLRARSRVLFLVLLLSAQSGPSTAFFLYCGDCARLSYLSSCYHSTSTSTFHPLRRFIPPTLLHSFTISRTGTVPRLVAFHPTFNPPRILLTLPMFRPTLFYKKIFIKVSQLFRYGNIKFHLLLSVADLIKINFGVGNSLVIGLYAYRKKCR